MTHLSILVIFTPRDPLMEDLNLDGFKFYLLNKDFKTSTVVRHLENIKFILQKADLKQDNIVELFNQLRMDGSGASYVNSLVSTFNHYRDFSGLERINLPYIRKRSAVKAIMSDEEIELFLSATPPPKSPRWEMWSNFFAILSFTGARPGEIAILRPQDVDFGRGVFNLIDTKTRENRFVPIPLHLLDRVKKMVKESDKYLFPGVGKDHIDKNSWKAQFNNRVMRVGIKRPHLTCHSLRHSFITRLIEEDVNLTKVGKLVGHKAIQTTAGYTHLTTKDLQDTLQKDRLGRRSSDPKMILVTLVEKVAQLFEKDDRFEKIVEDRGDEVIIRIKIKDLHKDV